MNRLQREDPPAERIPQATDAGFQVNLADWSDRQLENLLMDMRYGVGANVLIRQIAEVQREEDDTE